MSTFSIKIHVAVLEPYREPMSPRRMKKYVIHQLEWTSFSVNHTIPTLSTASINRY